MEKSPSIINLAKALKVFHANVGKIAKDATNPFFNSKYADLSTILEAIKQPLLDADLSFSQFPSGQNGLTTIIMHAESGEYMQSEYFMQPIKNDPQAQGSVITYMRRYSLAAVLGLNLDEDDDANSATHVASTPKNNHQKNANDDRQWLNENTTAFHEAVENLRAGSITLKDVSEQYKISKNVRAALQDAISNNGTAPVTGSTGPEKPWLDKNSKKWDLVTERLRNKTTTISQIAQFFKLNKEVRAELQAIVIEAGAGTPMDNQQ